MVNLDIVGAEDTTLSEAWQDGAAAYIGLTVPSFCNMFLVYGPNTNLNHNSIVSMLEIQHQYIADSVEYILENNASPGCKTTGL